MKNVMEITLIFIFIIGVINVLSPVYKCEQTWSNFLYVGGSEDGNYSSVQDAIDNASDGDIIYVFKGKYYENITVNKSITLIGENKNNTIIEGYIIISVNRVKISGFIVNNSYDTELSIGNGIEVLSNYSIITNNIISNNNNGIYIPGFSNNLFYHNNFINNTQNAYDEGNNTWFNVTLNQGNYWDDYNGLDKNNNGIGDTPYGIPGGNNKDNFPLMMPYDGTIRLKEFYVDYDILYRMLIIGIIVAILFCLPIAYIWYRKYYKVK